MDIQRLSKFLWIMEPLSMLKIQWRNLSKCAYLATDKALPVQSGVEKHHQLAYSKIFAIAG
jgi:hypothetical protein